MKSTLQKFLFVFVFLNLGFVANSQTRFGFVDVDSMIKILPEFDQSLKRVDTLIAAYSDTIVQKEAELMELYDYYLDKPTCTSGGSDTIVEQKLMFLQYRYQEYLTNAEQVILDLEEQIALELRSLVVKKMELFCKETGLIGIFDEKTSFYCSDCIDCNLAFKNYLLSN